MSERFPRLTASEVDEVLGRSGFGACTRPSTPRGLQDKKVSSWAWARVLKITRCFLGPPLIRAFLQETGTSHSGSVASQTWAPASGFTKFRSLESTRGATRRLASTSVGLVGVGVPHPPLQVG